MKGLFVSIGILAALFVANGLFTGSLVPGVSISPYIPIDAGWTHAGIPCKVIGNYVVLLQPARNPSRLISKRRRILTNRVASALFDCFLVEFQILLE